jgi:hypothetical protein
MTINRVKNQSRIQQKQSDLSIFILYNLERTIIIAFVLYFSSFKFILFSTSTKNGKENLEPDKKRRGQPEYRKHNHRFSTNRQRRIIVPLLLKAEPCRLIVLV